MKNDFGSWRAVLVALCSCSSGGAPDAGTLDVGAGHADASGFDAGAELDAEPVVTPTVAVGATELLGRPGRDSVVVSLVVGEAAEAYAEARKRGESEFSIQSQVVSTGAGEVAVLTLSGLQASSGYDYRVRLRRPQEPTYQARTPGSFHTARESGDTFTFTIQADSHLDDRSSLGLYQQTLRNVVADEPDFHVDLGDTFMTEKHSHPLEAQVLPAADEATVRARYLYERGNFAIIGRTVPLLLVNGNHEGESGWRLTGTADDGAMWAARARKSYFPNPTSDGFVSAPPQDVPLLGTRDSAWAFTWGDALFVGLDPYWWTEDRRTGGENWGWTLGEAQYRWLEAQLTQSHAKYKLVFLHHLVGGLTNANRGGAEAATLYEWGGNDASGARSFEQHRPGWARPIHELMVATHVTAVFHGHDHLYVHQTLDGIVYQEVPQPSNPNGTNYQTLATEGSYASGTVLGSSGHLRVRVSPDQLECEYVRSWTSDVRENVVNGAVTHRWTAAPGGGT